MDPYGIRKTPKKSKGKGSQLMENRSQYLTKGFKCATGTGRKTKPIAF